MLDSLLTPTTGITLGQVALCTLASLVAGVIIALVYMFKSRYTKNFVVTLTLMPAIVQAVILLVNGNLGVGIAVMGAFSLVRFRSVPGTAREISSIFFAMAVGLATGMGYLGFAALFTAVISLAMLIFSALRFGERGEIMRLRITLPEDVDYTDLFDDIFKAYTDSSTLERVRTTNLGSLFEITYHIKLKDAAQQKPFIDQLRTRNGNLAIALGRLAEGRDEL